MGIKGSVGIGLIYSRDVQINEPGKRPGFKGTERPSQVWGRKPEFKIGPSPLFDDERYAWDRIP